MKIHLHTAIVLDSLCFEDCPEIFSGNWSYTNSEGDEYIATYEPKDCGYPYQKEVLISQEGLQTYLREFKAIDVLVGYAYDTFKYAASVHARGIKKDVVDGFTMFDKYTDALGEGLMVALEYLRGDYE